MAGTETTIARALLRASAPLSRPDRAAVTVGTRPLLGQVSPQGLTASAAHNRHLSAVIGAVDAADLAARQSVLAVDASGHASVTRTTAVNASLGEITDPALTDSNLEGRGVTTPTTHRCYPVDAGGRALNENQRPGALPGEGVRKTMVRRPDHQRHRVRRVGLAVLCTFAVGALTAGNAFAAHSPHWAIAVGQAPKVAYPAFTGTETISTSNTTHLVFQIGASDGTFECTSMTWSGTIHGEYFAELPSGVVLSGCVEPNNPEGCTVRGTTHSDPAGTITTGAVEAELRSVASSSYLVMSPGTGSELVQLAFGPECVMNGRWSVTGGIAAKVSEQPNASLTLEFGKSAAQATGVWPKLGAIRASLTGTSGSVLTGGDKGRLWEAAL